ncbi:LIC_12616 family protein [Phytobacter diazotrophicus]|uniref:phage neck terminator protein n=1 Tax=Phytobacter diazotrophicus TaxID=395631 RepID=UPI002936A00B|nr:hypothetical protein [Phytobacter diazotrophicus]MDV2874481.1 hypothetical protein [Phytobacter diazotrophicus]
MTATVDYTVDNIIDTLADFIEPLCGTCQQAQANRAPMLKGQFCIITPLRFIRMSTTENIKQDTGIPSTSAMSYTEVRRADLQIDIYGDGAGDRANILETIFRSGYAWEAIKALDARLSPLYSSDAIQAPMINAEDQWQERYTLTLSLQADITVTLPQDYFETVEFTTEQADK